MDLNADIAEGFGVWRLGDDEALLRVITSANVACGFHGGDAPTIRRVCESAADRGVAVGAQVGYRDLAGFGRRRIDYEFAELRDEIIYQIGALEAFCRIQGDRVRYVKPHGALYHAAAVDVWQASAVVAAITDYDRSLPVLCQAGSTLATTAVAAGLSVVVEGFPDRAYRPDGTLVPRGQPGAVLSDVELVSRRAVQLATTGAVEAIDSTSISVPAQSLCVHADTPDAATIAGRIREALEAADIELAPFVSMM